MNEKDIVEILETFVGYYENDLASFCVIYPYQIPDIAKAIMDKIKEECKELKEIIAEYELNEPDKFGIGEIKEALKSVYGVVSDGSMSIILEKLNENKKQFIENMESI